MRKTFKNKRYPHVNTDDEAALKRRPVQNPEEYLDYRIDKVSDKTPLPEKPKQGGEPHGKRDKCTRQVYSSMEVAKKGVESLATLGYRGVIERCKACGLIHVQELRG